MPSRSLVPFRGRRAGPGPGSIGLVLPTFPQHGAIPTASELASTCRRAEEAGAEVLWACDHLFWHGPSVECLTAVTLAAATTTDVHVGTCVLQLPLREPAVVAKQAASINSLFGGRLVLGVGMGSHRGEYEAAGSVFEDRSGRLDEAVAAMRRTWAQTAEGSYLQVPVPPEIPVWIGGSSEAALRRSAKSAEGWIPLFLSPPEYAAAMKRLDKEADRAGRDPSLVSRACVAFATVGANARERGLDWMSRLYDLPARAFQSHLLAGKAKDVARWVTQYFEAGAAHVALFLACDDPLPQFEDLSCELARWS